MDEKVIRHNGFAYFEDGQGPVLMLLHGLMGALSNFTGVVQHFRSQFNVVIPLMPIFELDVVDAGVQPLYQYIKAFIDFKGYDKVSLLGNSLGGHVALVYAVNHQDRLNHLILTGSSGLYENAFGGSYPKRGDYEYIKKKVEITFYDPAIATKELVDEVFEIINDRAKLVRIISIAKSAIRHNMANELHLIQTPTCLIWGRNDIITPPEVAEEFHQRIKNSALFWIDKCGHAPMMEHPEQFNQILEQWLRHPVPN
ncbi:MAG: alpha/beta hydrolase [Flavobacteriales bacterium]|nr:alpha/beta hydrolase [Flavobacteriales bacterium]MCX7768368.1 alpha/beta hydrolase [Flavobacteriales bacterium]MDW8409072.1 alpha/beta hydrolase [Flavobacteriales bacterium]